MTENAYMTDDAWLEASKAIVKGYHQLPFMKENKDWYITELLDGFKSHKNVLKAHEICDHISKRGVKLLTCQSRI